MNETLCQVHHPYVPVCLDTVIILIWWVFFASPWSVCHSSDLSERYFYYLFVLFGNVNHSFHKWKINFPTKYFADFAWMLFYNILYFLLLRFLLTFPSQFIGIYFFSLSLLPSSFAVVIVISKPFDIFELSTSQFTNSRHILIFALWALNLIGYFITRCTGWVNGIMELEFIYIYLRIQQTGQKCFSQQIVTRALWWY